MNQFLLVQRTLKRTFAPFVLALLAITVTMARPGLGQDVLNKPVTLTLENVELRDVLSGLETQADVRFIHSPTAIQAGRRVSVTARHERLSVVLDRLLTPLAIDYSVVAGQILLSVHPAGAVGNPNDGSPTPQEQPYTGRVVTVTGEALPGVNLAIKGTNRGASTDGEGKFRIAANPGEVLVFSFIGYANQQVTLGDQLDLQIKLVESSDLLQEVTVIGSRAGTARTDVDRPVPVDVLSAKELQQTGQVEIGQQVQFTSPSFNSTKNGINGIANYADPASLKGLSPDQMLVLIDGKRRHQFAAVQNNVTVGKGTVVTDMNTIPALALERVEVLRDGAAAQYGSDAIAGIANLVLKKSVGKGVASIQYGQTSKGDGGGYTVGLNYGFALGKKGYLNLTGNYQDVTGTDRSDPYNPQPVTNGTYTGIYTNVKATDEAQLKSRAFWGDGTYGTFRVTKYGSNAMKSGQIFYNAGVPLSKGWSLYSFGGYSQKKVFAQAFIRTALATSANSNPDLYPDGYVPQLPGVSIDYSTVVGLKRNLPGSWMLDFSTGYGKNYLDQSAENSSNASMGADSPRNFYAGRIGFGQSLTELNFSKGFRDFAGTQSFNLALGAQYRVDNFQLTAGDPLAYFTGPLAATKNKTPGSQGRVGIDALDATDKSRSNIGLYVDVESDISSRFLVAAALRYENYSDFGSNISGKLATRLKLSQSMSVRGSINKGFRAPLLQQIANAATTSTVQSGVITSTKQLPSDDPRLAKVGIEAPKPETSWNYNLGFTAQAGRNFLFTIDAYQIDIADRIIITENLAVANVAALKPLFTGFREITFFTNQINTRTQGIDLVASYKTQLGKNRLNASLALTVNETKITNAKGAPAALQQDTKATVVLIDTISRGLIETSQPHTKILGSISYQMGKLNLTLRGTYFGEVTAWEKLSKPVAGTSNLHQSQTFGGKTVLDASVGYSFSKLLTLTVGSNNFTDVYPDRVYTNYASYTNGQVPYTRNANQFGFNGAYYYGTMLLNF